MHQTLAADRTDVSVHFLGEDAVLFDHRHQQLYAANACAAVIWCCLEDGLSETEAATVLTERHGVPPADARGYVRGLIEQWHTRPVPAGKADRWYPPQEPDRPSELRGDAATGSYQLLDTTFTIRYATPELFHWSHTVLQHLTPEAHETAGVTFDVVRTEAGYGVVENGRLIERCDMLTDTAAMLKACMIQRALEMCGDFCAIHAAGVRRDGVCILLPGESSAGKSSLTAGLATAGFELLGDDTIVLARDTLAARPVPFGIGTKRGAWPVLAERFPSLSDTPVHSRPDGVQVRYLTPPAINVAPWETRTPVSAVVFPHYDPAACTALEPLAKTVALERLMRALVPLRPRLTRAEVERLVRWIAGMPCYDLTLSTLDSGVTALGRVCP